jgi:hypothetical protein
MDEHRPFLKLVFSRELGGKDGRERHAHAMFDRLESILKRGQREKILRRDVDRSFAMSLLWSAKGCATRESLGLTPLAPAVAARSVVSLFLDGAGREEK